MSSFTPKCCPHCHSTDFIRKGHYYVQVLRTYRKRYSCRSCRKSFSTQTKTSTYRQKRPDLNSPIQTLLVNGVAQRAIARMLNCSKTTIEKKFKFLCTQLKPRITETPQILFIDEMLSIENTKLKPLIIPIAVSDRYEILGSRVGRIPAFGKLAKWSIKKYGVRTNEREKVLRELFVELKSKFADDPEIIRTDASSSYKTLVKEYFPRSKHEIFISKDHQKTREQTYLNTRKKKFNPLFPIDQRFGKLRAEIKRLHRRSWCTTKDPANLALHLKLYEASQKS